MVIRLNDANRIKNMGLQRLSANSFWAIVIAFRKFTFMLYPLVISCFIKINRDDMISKKGAIASNTIFVQ